jgi:hypothetical protein
LPDLLDALGTGEDGFAKEGGEGFGERHGFLRREMRC